MAHNLNIKSNGEASFFSVKEKAWHGLGKIVSEAQTSEEAIKLAGLDFRVERASLLAQLPELSTHEVKLQNKAIKNDGKYFAASPVFSKFATYRTDNNAVLGIIGKRYEIVQNTQAFDFFDTIVGSKQAIFETAGALGNGETIFITAKLPDNIIVKGVDIIEQYLFLTMSHDGSGSIQAAFTPVRIVCNNTLQLALKNCSNKIRIRHTKSAHSKLESGAKLMGIAHKASEEYSQIFERMSSVKVTDIQVKDFVSDLYMTAEEYKLHKEGATNFLSQKKVNQLNNVLTYYNEGIGQETITTQGTVFGLYNAITGYYQNVKTHKTNEDKFNNIFGGDGESKMVQAFDKALQLI